MFDNIGKKIKGLAKVICFLGIILAICIGVYEIGNGNNGFSGLIIIIGGALISWVSCFVLYGFGELVDKVCDIAENFYDYDSNYEEEKVAQITCPKCGTKHDFDYPKCPKCNHQYN
jgi:hypothetical protein